MYIIVVIVFFFKQKTAYEMRISDWSSDVCSSDLTLFRAPAQQKISWRSRECRSTTNHPGNKNLALCTISLVTVGADDAALERVGKLWKGSATSGDHRSKPVGAPFSNKKKERRAWWRLGVIRCRPQPIGRGSCKEGGGQEV